jgi:SAM-dependent methyltransferase/uncharacterized protein YbaR (Trm112 family)
MWNVSHLASHRTSTWQARQAKRSGPQATLDRTGNSCTTRQDFVYLDQRMTSDIALVCPGCRTHSPGRIELRTLERAGEVLVCECGRRYPIIDGVPIVIADLPGFLSSEMTTVVERDLAPEVTELLVEGGPDEAVYPRLIEHLSTYVDAHWGDRAVPSVDFGAREIVERIADRARDQVALAVELGCSVGRILAELAAGADRVVGIDLQFGAVRRARKLLDGEPLAYHRRVAGRHYQVAHVTASDRAVAAARRLIVCGDALDPPLVPGVYDRVVALNVLDSVKSPNQLLSVIDGLCAPGGEVILASPYAWQSSVMDDKERIGGADPAADVAAILRDGVGLGARYRIEEEADLSWSLRRDARSSVSYRTHYLRARKA